MDNKVNFLRGTATEYEASTKDNDTFYYTTDTKKLYLGDKEITSDGVTIDDTLSDTSEHPVQNKVITNALNTKANLTDIPTTLPANGGRSDTTNHQINHYLPDGKDVLTYATSDDCPYNVNTKIRIKNCSTCPTNYGYNAADNDFWYDIYKLDNLWVTIKAYDVRGNVEFINSCCNGTWSGWTRCNDGGNASSLNGYTVSGYDLYSPSNQSGGKMSCGTFNDSNGDFAFIDVIGANGNRTRVQLGSNDVRPRAYHYDATSNKWTEEAYHMAAYASTDSLTATNNCLRNISAGTADLSAGVSELATGAIYLVYE